MDPKKAAAEWFRTAVFRDEAIRPQPPRNTERVPTVLLAARSLETGVHQRYQSREALFLKQGKLLAGYEDDYDYQGDVTCYYPTYQALTNRQLRGYFSWRTKLRHGDVHETSLSFAFLYVYELINQIGVIDAEDGFRRLERFRDAYGPLDRHILHYLGQWLTDYAAYYELDPALLSGSPLVLRDRSITVLEHIQEESPERGMEAVKRLSRKWLTRSKFYADHQQDMDAVAVRVLRRMSAHYAARCKKTLVEQYFGVCRWVPFHPFDSAVFCDPLKRRNYEYAVDEQRIYRCQNGIWSAWMRGHPSSPNDVLGALLKTIDAVMRQEYAYPHPVKAEVDTKWILRIIQEEVQGRLAEQKAAEASKLTIDYAQLSKIRQDAAITREKLIVGEEADPPEEPAPAPQEPESAPEQLQIALSPALEPEAAGDAPLSPPEPGGSPLSPAEYRLLQCLLYGGDTGWVQAGGHLLSVLVDGINEKLYDTFLDTVLDDTPQLIDDYIDDLKEMVHP